MTPNIIANTTNLGDQIASQSQHYPMETDSLRKSGSDIKGQLFTSDGSPYGSEISLGINIITLGQIKLYFRILCYR